MALGALFSHSIRSCGIRSIFRGAHENFLEAGGWRNFPSIVTTAADMGELSGALDKAERYLTETASRSDSEVSMQAARGANLT
jgi:hypothetical protein